MYITLLVIYLLISIALISIVTLQHSKGADTGASLSPSVSTTLFGSSGLDRFITRMTAIFAILFFIISLILANLTSNKRMSENKEKNINVPVKAKKTVKVPTVPVPTKLTRDIPN